MNNTLIFQITATLIALAVFIIDVEIKHKYKWTLRVVAGICGFIIGAVWFWVK